MTALFQEIENKIAELAINDSKETNKTAIKRARKIALEVKKLLSDYRLDASQRSKTITANNKAAVAAGTRKQRPAPKRATSSF